MNVTKDMLRNELFYYIIDNARLLYCLRHYDEMLQQLNYELDNCNYFGEDGKVKTKR